MTAKCNMSARIVSWTRKETLMRQLAKFAWGLDDSIVIVDFLIWIVILWLYLRVALFLEDTNRRTSCLQPSLKWFRKKINHNGWRVMEQKCCKMSTTEASGEEDIGVLYYFGNFFLSLKLFQNKLLFKCVYTCEHACIFSICQVLYYRQPPVII